LKTEIKQDTLLQRGEAFFSAKTQKRGQTTLLRFNAIETSHMKNAKEWSDPFFVFDPLLRSGVCHAV
jgi:hypothetical protein